MLLIVPAMTNSVYSVGTHKCQLDLSYMLLIVPAITFSLFCWYSQVLNGLELHAAPCFCLHFQFILSVLTSVKWI